MTDKQIFQLLGLVYLCIGMGILLNPLYYKQMFIDFQTSRPMIYLGGLFVFLLGFLLVTFHNLWVKDSAVIITIIGWMAFIKGISLLTMPKLMIKTIDIFIKGKTGNLVIMAGFIIALGLLLSWLGFFAV